MKRLTLAENFFCVRCEKNKKAKLRAILKDEKDKVICNGCYGYLKSKEN